MRSWLLQWSLPVCSASAETKPVMQSVLHSVSLNARKRAQGGVSFLNGRASRNAVFCAMLAKDGLTGPSPVFDGPAGLFQISNYKFDFVADPRVPFQLMRTQVKSVPAGLYGKVPLRQHQNSPRLSKSMTSGRSELPLTEDGLDFMAVDKTRWAPETRETADHSLPFCRRCVPDVRPSWPGTL